MVLTEQEIRNMVKSTVEMILEARTAGMIYFPYRMGVAFKHHAIVQSHHRQISEQDVVNQLSEVSDRLANDFSNGVLTPDEVFKVVDRDSCLVSVCNVEPAYSGNRIHRILAITVYIWDGKMNYANTRNEKVYYIHEPSEEFIEATEWNKEHQDLVGEYTRWKHGIDVQKLDDRADYLDNLLNKPFRTDNVPSEKRLARVGYGMMQQHKEDMDKIYGEMSPEDFEAIGDYNMKMDYMPMASKGSANRDLRAMDLRKMRKDAARQREFYGDKVKDVPDEELVKYPKAVGKIQLSKDDLNKDRWNRKRK